MPSLMIGSSSVSHCGRNTLFWTVCCSVLLTLAQESVYACVCATEIKPQYTVCAVVRLRQLPQEGAAILAACDMGQSYESACSGYL
jgi:hypothetical protein